MSTSVADLTHKDVPESLFKSVKYYLIGSIDENVQLLLDAGGARRDTYLSEMVSLAIADDVKDEEYSEAVDLFEVPVVTPNWVILSVKCGVLLPTNAFNLETQQLFSKVVACQSKLNEDRDEIWSLLTFYGARCQKSLDKKVTHLIVNKPEGAKYVSALKRDVMIVTPDWVTDSVEHKSTQDEAIYHPRLLILESPEPELESPISPVSIKLETQLDEDSAAAPARDDKPSGVPESIPVSALPRSNLDDILDIVAASPHAVDEYWQANWEPKSVPISATKWERSTLKNLTNGPKASFVPKKAQQYEPLPEVFGHEPGENVPPDACLLGCVFFITDYQKYEELDLWQRIIVLNGGEVDADYSNRITHLLCESQRSDIFAMALKDGKRVVTAHWLNDCLVKRRMLPPWVALHVPSMYGDNKPCANQILCITNFEGDDRTKVKYMISVIGAKYTSYMTHSNSALICKKPGGMKYEKAKEWRIPVVNTQWLSDLVFGHLDALKIPINQRYVRLNQDNDFSIDLRKIVRLLDGWKSPLKISKESWAAYRPRVLKPVNSSCVDAAVKRKADDHVIDLELRSIKRARLTPTFDDENIVPETNAQSDKPRVMMTGLSVDYTANLVKLVQLLGGVVTNKSSRCTHLIARQIVRTMKFFTAISSCRLVVTPQWLEESARRGQFIAEDEFILTDHEGEKELGVSLASSLRKARAQPLFADLRFYITPETKPGLGSLREVVENAGGTVVAKRPAAREIALQKTAAGVPTFVVVGCENDLHILRDLYDRKIPVYNAEFILTGVLKQTVEFDKNLLTLV